MRENLKTILFIASVALNLAFAVTYATYKLPLFAGVRQTSPPGEPLFLHLDLTPGQLEQFSAERYRFHGLIQQLGQQIKGKQLDLIDLLKATPPDQQAIKTEQEEIQGLQRGIQNGVIDHFLRASAFLTPEQRGRFFGLIKSRVQTGLQACPSWMKPFGQGAPGENKNE
jgi:Spy/CpxP family protein refolding chaperone